MKVTPENPLVDLEEELNEIQGQLNELDEQI